MILIDRQEFAKRIPSGWRQAAKAALEELINAPDADARRVVLKSGAALWQKIIPALLAASHDKCWYCETKSERAACDVDHFRPKSSVRGCDHPGYWWLAFDEANLRLSCQYCNRVGSVRTRSEAGGKGDQFPLVVEEDRAMSFTDDVARERPIILDPTSAADVLLLWFDEDGVARPHGVRARAAATAQRVDESVRILNLNEEDLRQARFIAMQEFRRDYERAVRLYKRGNDYEFSQALRDVAVRARRESEYSAAARSALTTYDYEPESLARLILDSL